MTLKLFFNKYPTSSARHNPLQFESEGVYDEEVRRIFILIVFSILFFVAIPHFYDKAQADSCPIKLSPAVFPPDFNGEITITSNNCFATGVTYIILAYPQGTNPDGYSLYSVDRNQTSNQASLTGNLNLLSAAIGRDHPGPWTLKVCRANISRECGDPAKIFGTVGIHVSVVLTPTPTPTPIPSDLPKVFIIPVQCVFQVGSEVPLTLDNLQPNTHYRWRWHGDLGVKPNDIAPKDSNPTLVFTIPKKETVAAGIRTFCLDMVNAERYCTVGAQNTLTLQFTPSAPTGDVSCETFRRSINPTPTPTPVSPLPPCAQWIYLNGTPIPTLEVEYISKRGFKNIECTTVDTGLKIPLETDPAKFVKSIFSILLSVVGGIAVLLIIYSGYQLMFSQGNPEKIKEAQEQLTSAIVGLLFIIFSLAILQIIGVDILKIPGFGG